MRRILTNEELAGLRELMAANGTADAIREHAHLLLRRAGRLGVPMIRHPLGFVCLPALRGRRTGVCVHVWSPELIPPPLTLSPFHSHTWDLTSHVLRGRIENRLGRVTDAADAATHRVFAVYSTGPDDEIRPTRRLVRHRIVTTESLRDGHTYRLPAGRYHATSAGVPAATLVIADVRRPPPELALGAIGMPGHRVARRSCGEDERRIALDVLHECLEAGS